MRQLLTNPDLSLSTKVQRFGMEAESLRLKLLQLAQLGSRVGRPAGGQIGTGGAQAGTVEQPGRSGAAAGCDRRNRIVASTKPA
jgi:hypothetical protein